MSQKNVAIIGAGIIGTACAYELRRDGHEVTLYDRSESGAAASFGNSGVLSPSAVVPISMPGLARRIPKWLLDPNGPLYLDWKHLPRLVPWLVRFERAGRADRVPAISAALSTLNRETVDLLRTMLRDARLEHLIEKKGVLNVFRSAREFDEERFATELRRRAGAHIDELDAGELRDLEPSLSPVFTRGLFFPESAHSLNPYRVVTGLAEDFEHRGGKFVRAEVRGVRQVSPGRTALVTDRGSAEFDNIVIAAGVWSNQLIAPIGYRVPLETQRGYHVTIADPGVALNTVVVPVAHMITIVPMEMGVRIAGTVEFAGLRKPPDPRRAAALLRNGLATIPTLQLGGTTTWMGHRPCTPDSLPVLGPAPRDPALLFAFGHGHQGLLGSAKTAKIIANLVAGRKPDIDLRPFSADRF